MKDLVLDVGCGEIARGDVNIDQYVPKRIPANFILCSAEKLPFREASFGCVRNSYVIEHLIDPVKFINDCTMISKKKVVIITDNSDWLGEYYFRLVGSGRIFHPEHCYKWSVEYMRTLLSRLKIKAIVTPCNLSPSSMVKLISSFGKLPRIGIIFYRDISVEISKEA
jgi:ubiquinone/menaquinone biosynthesis C-methylase UbiE